MGNEVEVPIARRHVAARRCRRRSPARGRSGRADAGSAGGERQGPLVGWAFALAASTVCPLLLLGIWWDGLTARGAKAGLIAGAVAATGLIFAGLALGDEVTGAAALLAQPAVVSVPVAFAVMVLVSLRDRDGRR